VPGVGLVFLSLFLLQFLGEATLIILDGTFHTVSTLFYQLLTIHVVVLVNGRRRVNRQFLIIFLLNLIRLPLAVLSICIRINDEEKKPILCRSTFGCPDV
jgi:hypothetical protein